MAVIDFINAENKTYKGMKRAISYILNPEKTEPHLISGHNCDPENAYYEFVLTKRHFKKENGRQFIHFVHSFAPYEKVTPEQVHEIAKELMQADIFKGFQVVAATHTDKDHLHTHFIINTVNAETGLKWKQSREQLQVIKDYSDQLCRNHGLQVIKGEQGNYKTRGEYRSHKKGQSWKYELFLAVKACMRNSISKEDFISNMNRLGYSVNWTDERKYITFTTPEGKKCRNRKLYPPERFTKENLLKTFEMNKKYQDKKVLDERIELLFTLIRLLSINGNNVNSKYPLTSLEGQVLKDKVKEMQKGEGLDWEHESEREL
ncbi:MAG TPA: relaxase [Eubacteriaceae bacterium]|nr:relaxase [Eubacteriaceae bacterium]